uniref:Uncharacterized protein n=1 Tax=Solanum lycopersicum TaxID=4081 RepID=A0A3Q7FLN6_SOLLC
VHYDAMSVPMAIALPGCLLFGQPVIFAQLEHAKASKSLNCKLEIAGRTIKISSVAKDVQVQDAGAKIADFDDNQGGGLDQAKFPFTQTSDTQTEKQFCRKYS